ncbi:MAG: hypothetical protein ACREP6_16225, partial [Candidatus Binataceae bacterium]
MIERAFLDVEELRMVASGRIREREVEPVTMNVSEFLAKGGGSIKCMILDLGQSADLPPADDAAAFRNQHAYQNLFQTE